MRLFLMLQAQFLRELKYTLESIRYEYLNSDRKVVAAVNDVDITNKELCLIKYSSHTNKPLEKAIEQKAIVQLAEADSFSLSESEENKNNQQQQNQFQMGISPEVAEGTYSNLALITHSSSDFILDFAWRWHIRTFRTAEPERGPRWCRFRCRYP